MEEVITDLLLAEPVGRGVVVVGELPDGAGVSLLGAVAQASKLKILVHPLTEGRGHVKVLSQRNGGKASARDLEATPGWLPGSRVPSGNSHDRQRTKRTATLSVVASSCRGAGGLLEHAVAPDKAAGKLHPLLARFGPTTPKGLGYAKRTYGTN